MTVNLPSAHSDDPHHINRSGWLRAAVLGANDGIVSISSLVVGVASADPSPQTVLLAGVAGLTAGAMSMAAGEFVSVSSQSDIEKADRIKEEEALRSNPVEELKELAAIYEGRGLQPATAMTVAKELTEHDALGAHMRDELGLSEVLAANPIQAAIASGATFTIAGAIPLLGAAFAPNDMIILSVLIVTVLALGLLGAMGARAGGAPIRPAIIRVVGWGVFAMIITAAVGKLFGVTV